MRHLSVIVCVAALAYRAEAIGAQEQAVVYALAPSTQLLQDARIDSALNAVRRLLGIRASRPPRAVRTDTLPTRSCPMPVFVPDSSSTSRMPVVFMDSARSVRMPTARSACSNPLFRK